MFTDVEIRKIEDLTAKYGKLRYYLYFWDKLLIMCCRAGDFLSEKQIATLKEEGSSICNGDNPTCAFEGSNGEPDSESDEGFQD